MKQVLPNPHGGNGLINRIVPEIERESFVEKAIKYKTYTISDADLSMFYRMADGALSPLEGPMNKEEFYMVLDEEVIERNGNKYAWTIPIAFPISKENGEKIDVGETVVVKTEHGVVVGTLEIEDIYEFDKTYYNKKVYGTERIDHPGPRIFNDDPRDYLLGGKIWALPQLDHPKYGKYMLNPEETRRLFKERKWERIVAFQTRNALHRAHEYAMVYAIETLTREGHFTGAILNPLVGATKKDDVPADVRMRTYEVLLENKLLGYGDKDEELWKEKGYDLDDETQLIGLDVKMFYAGPKEAIMHAIYRQNYGFTDIVIGRKHADAPFDDGTPAWGDFDAHHKFDNLNGELQIKPAKVGFAAYFEELGKVRLIKDYKDKGFTTISISGKKLRRQLELQEPVDDRIMRKPVADVLAEFYAARKRREQKTIKSKNIVWHETGISKQDREKRNDHRGVVIWLTGLSGSGKSTIATALQAMLFEMGCHVYVLDGDNVRHGLNRDLGFSPEDREENIRRIGEVAKLFADSGSIVITSFISPYQKDRDEARFLVNKGDFVEVHVKAPLDVCEHRDPKGLYKKAREGIIKEFTGISAPYEEPENAEIIIETDKLNLQESVDVIIDYLRDQKVV
jgi:sulfate adenylyltransferase